MKKQFFYAAMAIAFMASCTSEDNVVVDPVNPTPEEDKVAIELGISSNAMTIGSRGTGMVGGVVEEGVTSGDDYDKATTWNSQKLYVTMVNRKDGSEVLENGKPIFDGLEFRAPSSEATGADMNNIRIYTSNGYDKESDMGTLQHKYYPITGGYDFYGYHLDDAQGTLNITPAVLGTDGTSVTTPATATVTGITIDGTQDIMAAKTQDVSSYSDFNPFSAKSARNNIKPELTFKHQLARLKFYVRSGEGSDAAKNYMDKNNDPKTREDYEISASNWTDKVNIDFSKFDGMLDGAIYVTDIKLLDVNNKIKLDLVSQTAVNEDATLGDFSLMTTPTTDVEKEENTNNDKDANTLIDLKPVAPEYAWGYNGTPTGETDEVNNLDGTKATPIGESIMFLPVGNGTDAATSTGTDETIQIQVTLGQCLIDTENEATTPHEYTYYWDSPEPVTLTLNANDLDVTDENKVFKPGKSYNVYITIYGRERIEISATLEPWVEGGDINTDIESGYQE